MYSELLAFYKKSNLIIIGLIFDEKSKQLFYHRYFVTADVRSWLIRMHWLTQLDHLLLRGSIPGTLTGIRMEWCSFGVSFLPRGGGELFSFGNDFARPRGRTQRICSRQWDKRGASMIDVWKCKSIGCVCLLFFPMKSKYYTLAGLTLKGWRRLLWYSWKLVKDSMLWVFILPHREGLFFNNFMPPTQGLWMVFVYHEKFPGVSRGLTHGKQMISSWKTESMLIKLINKKPNFRFLTKIINRLVMST